MRKKFSFIFPVVQQHKDKQRRSGISFEHLTDLVVTGVAYANDHRVLDNIKDNYSFEIESISYRGTEVSSLLHAFGSLDTICNACLNHVDNIFNGNKLAPETIKMNPYTAKIISFPLKRKISHS